MLIELLHWSPRHPLASWLLQALLAAALWGVGRFYARAGAVLDEGWLREFSAGLRREAGRAVGVGVFGVVMAVGRLAQVIIDAGGGSFLAALVFLGIALFPYRGRR